MNFPINFICAGKDYCKTDNYVAAPYFRKSFTVKDSVKSAKMLICGLGYYELYINGSNVTKGFMAPYRSNPDQIIYFDNYEIESNLKSGKNVIGVILGNGIQNSMGGYIWDMSNAKWRGAPELTFSLEIEYADGEKETVASDESTLTASSPIIFNDLHFGEFYDARLEIKNWNMPDFNDSDWKNAISAPTPRGEARLCEAEPITVQQKLSPVSITKQGDAYRYDFGVNAAGLCTLKIKGKCGQKVVLQHGETIVDEKLYVNNNRFNPNDRFQEDEYTCSGVGTEEYTPKFTYHGFRYVLVSGITAEQATKDLLTYLVINSDIETIGSFKCDDEIINKLQEATVRSDLANFYYFPTDCPQREKNGWTADAALSCEQMLLNLAPEKSYSEWMRNIYKSLNDEGQLPGIVPTTGWGYLVPGGSPWNGPAWDCVIAYIPYFTYIYRGDKKILEECAIPLMRYLNYLFTKLDENDLIAIGLGDWCPPGKREDEFKAPVIVTDSILTMDIAEKASFIYDVLGMDAQKEFADMLYSRVKNAIRKNLIDSSLFVKGNCQTSQAMGIFYGVFEESEKPAAFNNLLKLIDDENGHFDTGVLGGKVIFRVLAENGYADLAYNMITRPDFPSYGNWILRGATSLWEAFQPEGGRIYSLNHHFWGDISAWFYIYLAGIKINPTGKDVNNVNIAPCFVEKLSHITAEYKTSKGNITIEWKRYNAEIELKIEVPEYFHGNISLPDGFCFTDNSNTVPLKSGCYKAFKNSK